MMEAAPAGRSLFFFQHPTRQFGQIPLRAASRTKAAAAQRQASQREAHSFAVIILQEATISIFGISLLQQGQIAF